MFYDPRTVLLEWQPASLRGRPVTPAVPSWPAKDPSEILTLRADFSLLGASPQDAIIALAVVAQDPLVRVISSGKQGMLVTSMLAGGTPGAAWPVAFTVRLASGQILTRSVTLPVIGQPDAAALPQFPLPTSAQTLVIDRKTGLAAIDPATGEFIVTG